MERLTEWNGGQTRHAYYPRCFKEPCYGSGCKIKDCPFETAVCERLAAYEDTGLEPEAVETVKIALAAKHMVDLETLNNTPISRLVELAEADKDGRVVVLPCKVGQRVFALLDTDKHISECEVKQIGMGNEIGFIGLEPIGARGREYGVALNGFGKTVFLTREAAEKALEGIKDGY
jgi:hypothetical protein|nr:MAG TPA: hypothetical protein [Caudoviricetes sp.]